MGVKLGGGQGELGRTHCPLELGKVGQASGLKSATSFRFGIFQINSCLLVVSKKRTNHHSGGSIKETV